MTPERTRAHVRERAASTDAVLDKLVQGLALQALLDGQIQSFQLAQPFDEPRDALEDLAVATPRERLRRLDRSSPVRLVAVVVELHGVDDGIKGAYCRLVCQRVGQRWRAAREEAAQGGAVIEVGHHAKAPRGPPPGSALPPPRGTAWH